MNTHDASKIGFLLVPLILAVPIALVIASNPPTLSLAIIMSVFVLVIAFLSTTASLYLLVFSMLLGPEILVGTLGGGAVAGRGMSLRLDDFLLVVIGLTWLAKMAFFKKSSPFTRTPLNGPIMLYIAASVLVTLIGVLAGRVKPVTGFFYLLKYYEYVFIYFMVVSSVTSQKQAKALVIASLVTCFLVSLYAITQIPSGARASAPFEGEAGEPNTLGGYLVFMLAIVTGLLLTAGAVPTRLPFLLLLGTGGLALMATLSRSAFLGAAMVILAMTVLVGYRKPLLLALLLIGIFTVPLWLPSAVVERVMFTVTQAPEAGQIHIGGIRVDTSTSERIQSWKKSMEYFYRYPFWGTGVTGGPYFMDAMYPRILVETGLLGATVFAFLLWSIFRAGLTAYKHAVDPFPRGVALGFLFGFLGLLVHAVGANTFIIVRIMEPFWLFAALVVKSHLLAQIDHTTGNELGSQQKAQVVEGPTMFPTARARPQWRQSTMNRARKQ